MMAASGKPGWDQLFPPLPAGFRKVRYGDVSAAAQAITPHTTALMVEPIQGEAGVVVPPPGYLRALRQLADERNVLLILDEVQTGIARTGTLFAFQHEQVAPDIMTLGKGLGAGFPISATLARRQVACFDYGDQGGTFNGNPLGTAVANTVLELVANDAFLTQVVHTGRYLEQCLSQVLSACRWARIRGRGLLWAIEFDCDCANDVRDVALAHGLLINAARPNVVRMSPSLRVTRQEVDEAIACLGQVLPQAIQAAS